MELRNLHVVLTGATGGLGTKLALALAAQGAVVGLVGRDPVKLHALQKKSRGAGWQVTYYCHRSGSAQYGQPGIKTVFARDGACGFAD